MAGWQDDRMTGWQDGRMTGWQDDRMTGWGGRRWGMETVAESHLVNAVNPVCGEEEDRMAG
jgi:hypothetical protein